MLNYIIFVQVIRHKKSSLLISVKLENIEYNHQGVLHNDYEGLLDKHLCKNMHILSHIVLGLPNFWINFDFVRTQQLIANLFFSATQQLMQNTLSGKDIFEQSLSKISLRLFASCVKCSTRICHLRLPNTVCIRDLDKLNWFWGFWILTWVNFCGYPNCKRGCLLFKSDLKIFILLFLTKLSLKP